MAAAASIPNPAEQPQSTRRDFLVLSAAAFASVGAAAGIWPMLHSLSPSADTKAEATTEVNLARIEPGQAITVRWQGKPVFIVHRTEAQIARAEADDKAATLDPAKDRTRVKRREWLVVVGVCTHLGCVPDLARGRRSGAALRRLGVPVPLFAVRHLRPRPPRPCADQPGRPALPVRGSGPASHRLKLAGERRPGYLGGRQPAC